MKFTAKATTVEFTVTGEDGAVVTSYTAENVNMTLDSAALLTNLSSLAHLFKQLDASHNVRSEPAPEAEQPVTLRSAVDSRPAALVPRMEMFYDSIKRVIAVVREEEIVGAKFDALCEQAERLLAQPEFEVNDLVDISFDLFSAQTNKHWDCERLAVAMKAMQSARTRRRG